MVMHARKQPRVNDGYSERKDAHLHQWLDRHQSMQHQQKGYGGLYGDGSPAEGSHGPRGDSPGGHTSPRYHNKGSYLERNKDKRGSLSLAEKKVNQYLATGSIGQNAPGTHRDHRDREREREREQRPEGNHHEGNHGNHGQMPGPSGSKRGGPAGGGGGGGAGDGNRDHRAEVQKSAVRVCGDWSEHISSSGKRYYYNCKTEVSQWEKPKEWHDGAKPPDRSRDNRGNAKPSTSSTTTRGDDRQRHSSTDQRYDNRSRVQHMESSSSATPEKHLQRPSDRPKSQAMDVSNSSSTPGPSMQRGGPVQRNNSTHTETSHSQNHAGHMAHPDLKRNSVYPYGSSSGAGEPARKRTRHESDNNRPLGPPSHRGEAIQTLQELQKALTLHIKKQQSKGGSQTASSSTGTTSAQLQTQLSVLQQNILQQHQQQAAQQQQQQHILPIHPESPHHSLNSMPTPSHVSEDPPSRGDHHHHHHHHHGERDGRDSPLSDISARSSCRSPTPSTGSSQNAPAIGTSALSAAALKSQQSVTLTPSLSNYYNEKLIGHVLGWQAEQIERQAERFRQEGLALGSLHCSRVSVDLKRARSNVRTAEIQSTIHEQRKMVLQQQRAEIENLKIPTSLLPS
ncbi:WW domain-containing adapter protein with coiled-coil-like isoform X2 [Littorina saxatilis]|uniref:WW domain-containing adapter protein with coiled-coil-like isoform X2 n=1 Tax=Littorina saxatilis TaxID=31220 RepID=UPI0038B58380